MSGAVEGVALREAQDARRSALVERLGTIADLACATPLPGDLGDVAYDLLRQAAAQISSDRLHIARLTTPPARSYADGVEDAAKVADKSMRRHRRYVANGRKLKLSDQATHNDQVMALEAKEIAAAIRLLSQGEKA